MLLGSRAAQDTIFEAFSVTKDVMFSALIANSRQTFIRSVQIFTPECFSVFFLVTKTFIELQVLINKMPYDCDIPLRGKTSAVIGSEGDAWLGGDCFNQISLELITCYEDIPGV